MKRSILSPICSQPSHSQRSHVQRSRRSRCSLERELSNLAAFRWRCQARPLGVQRESQPSNLVWESPSARIVREEGGVLFVFSGSPSHNTSLVVCQQYPSSLGVNLPPFHLISLEWWGVSCLSCLAVELVAVNSKLVYTRMSELRGRSYVVNYNRVVPY